ncbi:periplasmic heavy metal sensor [Pseudoduganella violaceinigra]|uniref:periplasmic heavy metal sensor n=1 Tax=Pseudoduganella violaceinigra TaxID=246602 RepID=UPI000400072E|nr:periplasmic heavy metal sensor [Pseudoduganella violaceinigra]
MSKKTWIAVATAVAALGGSAFAAGHEHGHGHGQNPWTMDATQADKHIEKMVEHILPDGTAAQKTRLNEIAKACFNDVKPIHQQLEEGHDAMAKLLSQPAIDRVALENARAGHVKNMDLMSRRVLAAAMDAAEVLSPEQRAKFNGALHMMATSHMGRH